MYEFASGAAAPVSVGLIGAVDPPVTPEAVGPAPSNFEAPPVPLRSFESILAEHASAVTASVAVAEPAGTRRVVLRLLGGEQLELAAYGERDDAVAAARELMSCLSKAESVGEWAEVDDRFIRPASVASIDVLSAE